MIAGVIVVHTAITYGAVGSFYLADLDERTSGAGEVALSLPIILGAIFGMGLLFLVAGSLTVPSLERKGAGRFVLDRLRRLGVPLVLFMLIASPVLEYVKYRVEGGHDDLLPAVRDHALDWPFAPGPLWFVEALLVFSFAYVGWRALRARRPAPAAPARPLTGRDVATLVVVVAAASYLVRLAAPIGSAQFHLQLAFFPQYVCLFAFGTLAFRHGWVAGIDPGLRRRSGQAALLAAVALPLVIAAGGGTDDGSPVLGGFNWQALLAAIADSTLASCASIWVLETFRRRRADVVPGELERTVSDSAYGAYILHPLVVVGLALALHPVDAPAELKFIVVAPLAIAGSFALATLARRRVRDLATISERGTPSRARPARTRR